MTIKVDGPVSSVSRPADTTALTSITRAGGDRSAAVAAPLSVDSMQLTGDAAGLKQLERGLDKSKQSFDTKKVEAMRTAIAQGTYRVDPHKIARNMIDMESELYR